MEIAINENLLRAYGLEPELEYVQLLAHTTNSICRPKMRTYKNQRIFKFHIPTANGICGNSRINDISGETIIVKNTIVWERADEMNTLSVKIPLANVTCLFDKTTYIGLSAGPILPISRTAVLSWQERVSFQARMSLWNDRSFLQPIRSNMLKTGENVFAKITLADENVNRPFDTSNLVNVVENCFATQKDSPNVPQTLFIANSCPISGMEYFSEVIKSGQDHEIFLRFKVFEWKNTFNNLQEIYFRCRITICDKTMEECGKNCNSGNSIMGRDLVGRNRRKRDLTALESSFGQENPGAVVTSEAVILELDQETQEKIIYGLPNRQVLAFYGSIAGIIGILSIAVTVLFFRKNKSRVVLFDQGHVNRATSGLEEVKF